MSQRTSTPFQRAIDIIETLPPEDQETLIDLVHRRLIERRRAEIARPCGRRPCRLCGKVERRLAPLKIFGAICWLSDEKNADLGYQFSARLQAADS